MHLVKRPTVYICLQAPVAVTIERIKRRLQASEEVLEVNYLKLLERYSEQWHDSIREPKTILNTQDLDESEMVAKAEIFLESFGLLRR